MHMTRMWKISSCMWFVMMRLETCCGVLAGERQEFFQIRLLSKTKEQPKFNHVDS